MNSFKLQEYFKNKEKSKTTKNFIEILVVHNHFQDFLYSIIVHDKQAISELVTII